MEEQLELAKISINEANLETLVIGAIHAKSHKFGRSQDYEMRLENDEILLESKRVLYISRFEHETQKIFLAPPKDEFLKFLQQAAIIPQTGAYIYGRYEITTCKTEVKINVDEAGNSREHYENHEQKGRAVISIGIDMKTHPWQLSLRYKKTTEGNYNISLPGEEWEY